MSEKMKNVILYHEDLDGMVSASVVCNLLMKTQAEKPIVFIPIQHGENAKEKIARMVPTEEMSTLFMLDFTPAEEGITTFMEEYDHLLLWIDHHDKSVEIAAKYNMAEGNREVRTNDEHGKVSAAFLTTRYIAHRFGHEISKPLLDAVRLTSLWDTFEWKKGGTRVQDKVLSFRYGMEEIYDPKNKNSAIIVALIDKDSLENVICKGKEIFNRLKENNKKQAKLLAFPVAISLKDNLFLGWAANTTGNSMFFDSLPERDFCLTFSFEPKQNKWKLSMYSNNHMLDCNKIMSKLGGGGHNGAAGAMLGGKKLTKLVEMLTHVKGVKANKKEMLGETIGDLIDAYTESKSKIFKKLGCDICWIPLYDYTDVSWEQKSRDIYCPCLECEFSQMDRYESGDYVMILTINDYGENEALIFDKNKNIKLDD